MDLSAVQCYCGGKWTGEYRRTDQMLQVMSHILLDNSFQELAAGLVDGVQNILSTELRSEEVVSLLTMNNLPTVAKNPELVDKTILKEERNHLSLVFSKHLAYFTPNLGNIKLGILDNNIRNHVCIVTVVTYRKHPPILSTTWSIMNSVNQRSDIHRS